MKEKSERGGKVEVQKVLFRGANVLERQEHKEFSEYLREARSISDN